MYFSLSFNLAGRPFSSKDYFSFQIKYSAIYLEENIGAVYQFLIKVWKNASFKLKKKFSTISIHIFVTVRWSNQDQGHEALLCKLKIQSQGSNRKSVTDPVLFAPSSSLYSASSELLETNLAMLLRSLTPTDYAIRVVSIFKQFLGHVLIKKQTKKTPHAVRYCLWNFPGLSNHLDSTSCPVTLAY